MQDRRQNIDILIYNTRKLWNSMLFRWTIWMGNCRYSHQKFLINTRVEYAYRKLWKFCAF